MEELLRKLDRDADSHKGQNGKVGVIAGSKDYTGAPALASKAALRTGSDLVKTLTSESVRDVVAGFSENFMVNSYSSNYFSEDATGKAESIADWGDAVVIGPGLGDADEGAVTGFVERADAPLVIDADVIEPALDADLSDVDAVFTPHRGEIDHIEELYGSLRVFAEREEVVVVLKGEIDRVYTPDDEFDSDTGTAAMTVGGTGDVLTGVIASLISQGLELEDAALLGAWINGKAGEIAADGYGNGMLATDMVDRIPGVLRKR